MVIQVSDLYPYCITFENGEALAKLAASYQPDIILISFKAVKILATPFANGFVTYLDSLPEADQRTIFLTGRSDLLVAVMDSAYRNMQRYKSLTEVEKLAYNNLLDRDIEL